MMLVTTLITMTLGQLNLPIARMKPPMNRAEGNDDADELGGPYVRNSRYQDGKHHLKAAQETKAMIWVFAETRLRR